MGPNSVTFQIIQMHQSIPVRNPNDAVIGVYRDESAYDQLAVG